MTVLLYAITDGDGTPAAAAGVHARPVQAFATGGLTALVSEHDRAPSLDADSAWAFERVVESAMNDAAVVPARFGTAFTDLEALSRTLAARHDELTTALGRVRGRVELSVRAIERPGAFADDHDTAQRSGRDYMQDRLAPVRRARAVAARMRAELDALAVASRYRLMSRPEVPVAASYLVSSADIAEFARRADGVRDQLSEHDLVCTGPWPAYSFVGDDHA